MLEITAIFQLLGLACGSNGSPMQGEAGVFDVLAQGRSTTADVRPQDGGGDGGQVDARIDSATSDVELESGTCVNTSLVAPKFSPECTACLAANNCCYEFQTCLSCETYLDCLGSCERDGGTNCITTCISETNSSATAVTALRACGQTKCSGDSAGACAGP
jgi:hypothetical protein